MPEDADEAARELSGLLRTVAASVALEPVTGMESKRDGDLFGECPFHLIVAFTVGGRPTRRRERTLYVRLAERRWQCIRCGSGGGGVDFAVMMGLHARMDALGPTGLAAAYHGGPGDGTLEELDPKLLWEPSAEIHVQLPARVTTDGPQPPVSGKYVLKNREGEVLHYDWVPDDEGHSRTNQMPDDVPH